MTKIKPLSFQVKNVRLIKDIKVEFPENGVIVVKGKNEIGKSTLIELFRDMISANNTTRLSDGVVNGSTEGEFVLPSGEVVLVRQDLSEGKTGCRFMLVDPNGNVKKRVQDIKDLFGYNDVTIESFIALGGYSEGRRRQRDYYLEVLGSDVKKAFLQLEVDEERLYKERTAENQTEFTFRQVKENFEKVNADIINNFSNEKLEAANREYQDAEIIYLEAYKTLENHRLVVSTQEGKRLKLDAKNKELQNKGQQYKDRKKFYEDELIRIQKQRDEELKILEDEGLAIKKERDELQKEIDGESAIDLTHLIKEEASCKEKMLELKSKYEKLRSDEVQLNTYYSHVKNHKESKAKADKLDGEIERVRQEKNLLVVKSPCAIDNLRLTIDGLEAYTNNVWLPLDDKHIATSVLIDVVCDLILALNKNLPIVLISRGESIDSDRIKRLAQKAKDTDAIYLVEKVTDNLDEIICEVIEP